MNRCLIVDDDLKILNYVSTHLEKEHFQTYTHMNAKDALECLNRNQIDIAIVDIMMEGIDGFELCQIIKEDFELPVIMLTARDALSDKERAFLSGTDDYLTKPFEVKELIFRIKAVLRRYDIHAEEQLVIGDLTLQQAYMEVIVNDKTMMLPNKEFQLLFLLATNKKQILTREHLIEKIWGVDYEGDERTVDVHIKRLRQRLAQLHSNVTIKTVRGQGYKVEVNV
ncbi:response regulator transcription factor [Staphylococcus pasteuri]|uniref:response regulator transcription factor n=1 Tax=Staphylococcus pasteuri TaxID=45972 RepID=UPI000F4590A9|nr:response regulator transcription factor [Staphylococcus pasteuri]RNM18135.1 DNA-binding response regulator [Staphylococcus pasteuri]